MSAQTLDSLRGEVEAAAATADQKADEVMAASAPEGEFSQPALNRVVSALNLILPMFGPEADAYPEFASDSEVLPPDFMQALTMVAAAAGDADMGEILSSQDFEVFDDRGLTLLAGKLRTLGQSRDFKQFLKQGAPDEEPVVEVVEEAPMVGAPEAEDELLMQRV